MNEVPNPLISVIVCTYNRAESLYDALKSLAEQDLDKSKYEILVVDNNSTDNTSDVVKELKKTCANLYYCVELKQGLSHARNRGWQEARGAYVAYTDDDCKLPSHWLSTAEEITNRASPVAFGGPVLFRSSSGTIDPASVPCADHVPFNNTRFLEGEQYKMIFGCNMVFRKDVFTQIGGFDPHLGPKGGAVGYGDDTELLRRVSLTFPKSIYYDPRLFVFHLILPGKMTWRYTVQASFAAGRTKGRMYPETLPDSSFRLVTQLILTLVRLVADVPRHFMFRNRGRTFRVSDYVKNHTLHYVQELGSLYEKFFIARSN